MARIPQGFIDDLLDRQTSRFLDIAHGCKLDVGLLQETTQVIASATPDPDPSHHDPFAGWHETISSQRGGRNDHWRRECTTRRSHRRLQKTSSTNSSDFIRHRSLRFKRSGRTDKSHRLSGSTLRKRITTALLICDAAAPPRPPCRYRLQGTTFPGLSERIESLPRHSLSTFEHPNPFNTHPL